MIRKSIPKKLGFFPVIFLLSSSVFILLFATFPSVHAQSALVQQNNGGCATTSCSPSPISFPGSVTAGDMVVVVIAVYSGSVVSVGDTRGSTFTLLAEASSSPIDVYSYDATLSSSGSDSISVTFYGATQGGVYIYEVSRVTTVGAVFKVGGGDCYYYPPPCSQNPQTGSASFQSGAFLVSLVAGTDYTHTSVVSTTAGANFTLSPGSSGGTDGGNAEYATSGVSSPTDFPFTLTSVGYPWVEMGLALAPSGSTSSTTSTTTSSTSSSSTSSTTTISSTTTSTSSSTTSTTTLPPPSMAHVSITLNPDATSNPIGANNFFLVSYNDGAQEFAPQQGGTLQIEATIGSQISIAAKSSGSNSQEAWCLQGTSGNCNQVQFAVDAGGDAVTYTYYDLLSQTVSYAIHGGGNPNPPTMTFLTVPSTANSQDNLGVSTITLSSSVQTILALRTFAAATPVQLSGFGIINTSPPTPNEQWSAGFASCCAITGPNVIPNPIIFYIQFSQQVSYSVSGGNGYSAPILTYKSGGSTQQFTLGTTPFSLYVDGGSSWSVSNPLPGSSLTHFWKAPTLTSDTISGPGTINPAYVGTFALQVTESNGISDFVNSLSGTQYKIDLVENNFVNDYVNTIHGIQYKLSFAESNFVSDFLNGRPIIPVLVQLIDNAGPTDSSNNHVGVPFSGPLVFIVHSPVNILVTDTLGRQAGFNSTGGMINIIPGAQIIPKNATQLETIIIPDPLSGQYIVEVFPVNGGGNYSVELKSTNVNGTVVTDTHQTGSVTSGTQYIGVTLSSSGLVTETPPSSTPPFQHNSVTMIIIIAAIGAVAVAAAGSALFILRRHR